MISYNRYLKFYFVTTWLYFKKNSACIFIEKAEADFYCFSSDYVSIQQDFSVLFHAKGINLVIKELNTVNSLAAALKKVVPSQLYLKLKQTNQHACFIHLLPVLLLIYQQAAADRDRYLTIC